MKKKFIILICLFLLIISLFLVLVGRKRADVYLGDFKVSSDGKIITLNVGVASSAGYIRSMKKTSESKGCYVTFYSTFGINSKLGSRDTFEIELNDNMEAIYFYSGNEYKKVLAKDENDNWYMIRGNINDNVNVEEKINEIVNNGPLISSNPFDYINASQDIYDELLKNKEETFKYAMKDLIESNASLGLKSYIEILLCSEINQSFKYDFEPAIDFLDNYKKHLINNNSKLSEYDKYAKELLK